jgi:hypothetical protein
MQHAGPGAGLVDAVRTGSQQKGLLQGGQGAVDRPGRGEGAEIVALDRVRPAMLADLRRAVVAADHQLGERLVVAQHHVEARLQLLDEVGFEQQGLGLGGGDHQLHRPGQGDHQADPLSVEPALRILKDALLERARLAHIQAGPVLAVHPVDARLVRRAPGLVADQVGGAQGSIRLDARGIGNGHSPDIGWTGSLRDARRIGSCHSTRRGRRRHLAPDSTNVSIVNCNSRQCCRETSEMLATVRGSSSAQRVGMRG